MDEQILKSSAEQISSQINDEQRIDPLVKFIRERLADPIALSKD